MIIFLDPLGQMKSIVILHPGVSDRTIRTPHLSGAVHLCPTSEGYRMEYACQSLSSDGDKR